MKRRRVPIRWRLTAWYAALLATALVGFGAALYVGLRLDLYNSFDEQLRSQAALLQASIQLQNGRLAFAPNPRSDPLNGEHFVRLLTADGRIVADTSAALDGVPLDPAVVAAARAGQTRFSSWRVEHQTLRIISTPVMSGGQVVGVLQVGMFRGDVEEALDRLLLLLGVATPLVLLVAVGGGYLLAGRALSPVAAITRLAARVGADDLHARLDLPLPDDELGRLARTFDAMLARIEDAFARQRRFTDDAAHELRTPLSLMQSQVDLALARPRSPEEYREALRGLEGDLDRLTGLVGTLLTLARADTDRLPIDRAAFDLAETIAVVLEQYAGPAAAAGVTLRGETAPTPVRGDEDLIMQILVNLLENALAHTPAGGTINVGCAPLDRGARVWVTDSGIGIAPEHLERIFDRFYRVDQGRARAHGGTGLGLAICRALAEAHGGAITAISEVGKGATFEIRLPDGN